MFDPQGRKRITLESVIKVIIDGRWVSTGRTESEKPFSSEELALMPDAIPLRAVAIGDSSSLEKVVLGENIGAFDFVDMTIGEHGDSREILRDKGILFLPFGAVREDIREIAAKAQEIGTRTLGVVPTKLVTEDIQSFANIDNIIGFHSEGGDHSDSLKTAKTIKTLWHACQHKGLICIDARDIESFLSLGKIIYAGIGRGCMKDRGLRDTFTKALHDFACAVGEERLSVKGAFCGIEIPPDCMLIHLAEIMEVAEDHFGVKPYFYMEINSKLEDNAIMTIMGIP